MPAHITRRFGLFWCLCFLMSASGNGPAHASALSQDSQEHSNSPAPTHIAFAGGGWRAHVGHSGWMLALLKEHDHSLDHALRHVDTVSSNSGGSWFSTMLMYSPDFAAAIQQKQASTTWANTGANASGWLGQQQTLFAAATCPIKSGNLYTLCVFDEYAGGLLGVSYWHKIIANLVFRHNPIEAKLSDPRLPWAQNKTLLLAASLLVNQVVIGRDGMDEQYYQACISPSKPITQGSKGARCQSKTAVADVSPLTFSRLPNNSINHPLPFYRALSTTDSFNSTYTEAAWWRPAKATASLSNPINSADVPVIVAAAASSAAAGFAASKSVTGSWAESWLATDEALAFKTAETLEHQLAQGMSTSELAANKMIQVADGGAVDNSAVAQVIAHLQLNKAADDFQIVAFDNVQTLYTAQNGAQVGVDIANLFGEGLWQGKQICSQAEGQGDCVNVPPLQIFVKKALDDTPVAWRTNNGPNQGLLYSAYKVTTVDNPVFGIKGGQTGTLHAFTAVWADAKTAPQNSTEDFEAYANMLAFIINGLQHTGDDGIAGIDHLQRALGHSKP